MEKTGEIRRGIGRIRRFLFWRGHWRIREGSGSVEELSYLAEVAKKNRAKLIGEIGFNAGFSSYAFLIADAEAKVVSFDLGKHSYLRAAKEFIDREFPGRHWLVLGDSTKTVPQFKRENPDMSFDLIFIDGSHQYEVARADIENMKEFARADTPVIIDDLIPWRSYGTGPTEAWQEAQAKRMIVQRELFREGKRVERIEPPGKRSWALGYYIQSKIVLDRVLIATSNAGKLRDFAAAAAAHGIEIAPVPGFDELPGVVEDGATFEANARKKAEHYSRRVGGEVVLADDSGLEVEALGGAPGVHSARYAAGPEQPNAGDAANNARLLREMEQVEEEQRTAQFVCVIAAAREGRTLATFRGEARGRLLRSPRGSNGFGYDPLFYFPSLNKTFAELTAEEKAKVSHRGAALRKFLEWYEGNRPADVPAT